jgi:phosphoribosylformimino-5-aminoimidazole carboxamide ribotide isomerase
MRIIPVLDILGGQAVHARGGHRDSYAPLSSQLTPGKPGDALAIARAFRDRLGFRELYLADLDAITGRAAQRELRRAVAAERSDVAVWTDGGVGSAGQARELLADGATRVIVGLETLPAASDPRSALEVLAAAERSGRRVRLTDAGAGGQPNTPGQPNAPPNTDAATPAPTRAVFSLDLRAGQPSAADPALRSLPPLAIAELAAACGIATIIVLDLARVGTGTGPDLRLVREIRRALPHIELVAGGGIRDAADLERLADAGADAALVGSALHHGSTAQGSILRGCG